MCPGLDAPVRKFPSPFHLLVSVEPYLCIYSCPSLHSCKGYFPVAVHGPSSKWLLLLWLLALEHGLDSCGAHRLSSSAVCGIFPSLRSHLCPCTGRRILADWAPGSPRSLKPNQIRSLPNQTLVRCWWECKLKCFTMENSLEAPQNLKMKLLQPHPNFGISKGNKISVSRDTCTPVSTAALFNYSQGAETNLCQQMSG